MPEFKPEIRNRLASMRLEPQREAELVEELAQHLDDFYAEQRARGLGEDAARVATLAELSGLETHAPELRRRAGTQRPNVQLGSTRPRLLETMLHDVRFALRTFRTNPAFASVAVLTFAIGIGACTLMFSAANGVLLRPLPDPEPDRLVAAWGTAPQMGLPEVNVPTGLFEVFRTQTRTLAKLAAWGH
ncbi:MAG TPA: hypothetical protein VFT29_04235, partial [Gemmatimonadaceae bacterium]|nr:hypothetical protein [Gemmatimonadaceae bacterium]